MTNMRSFGILLGALLLLTINGLANQIYYEETINNDITYRVTRASNAQGVILFEETLNGNDEFGTDTDFLSYKHSVADIEPPVLPDGIVRKVRLKLYLRNSCGHELILAIDSVDLEEINRRHFLVGPSSGDSVSVEDSPMEDGQVVVALTDPENEFMLYRSVFEATYTPSIVMDAAGTESGAPGSFRLGANYPNPFNPMTTIQYVVESRAHIGIEIFNVLGKPVKTLVDESKSAGAYTIVWTGKDDNGNRVASGIYFYRLSADSFADSRKMILLK